LINRPNAPFRGSWALPGGYVPRGETTLEALQRIIDYKTGISVSKLPFTDQLHTFDAVARDPRGHAVSITYLSAGHDIKSPKTAAEIAWFPADQLPAVAFDHHTVGGFGRERLVAKALHSNIVKVLLPPLFTMSELQQAYEAILGRPLDKRNFQKKFFRLDQVVKTDKLKHNTNSRPARLYKFKTATIDQLADNLD
jgi:8-oxo-dGTP diphosphatase